MKFHKIYYKNVNTNISCLFFYNYDFLIISKSFSILNRKQINSFLKVLKLYLKKYFEIFLFFNDNYFSTKKAIGVRMGKGKGSFYENISYVKAGKPLFGLKLLDEKKYLLSLLAIKKALKKISFKCYFVDKKVKKW